MVGACGPPAPEGGASALRPPGAAAATTALAWRIRRAVETAMAILLLAMGALTFADVIGRRLFAAPVYGAHDLTEHLMALVVFTGLPLVTAAGAHLTIDLFDRLVGHRRMAWRRLLSAMLVVAVLALVAFLFLRHGLNAGADLGGQPGAAGAPCAPLLRGGRKLRAVRPRRARRRPDRADGRSGRRP